MSYCLENKAKYNMKLQHILVWIVLENVPTYKKELYNFIELKATTELYQCLLHNAQTFEWRSVKCKKWKTIGKSELL